MSNRTQYENDLAALKTALTEMGQSAADAVEAAMEALCTADAEAAAAVAQGDGRINNMERDIQPQRIKKASRTGGFSLSGENGFFIRRYRRFRHGC